MNNKQYTIRNCPGLWYRCKDICVLEHTETGIPKSCNGVPDCLLKRIYDECKGETEIDINERGDLAERIMALFEVREVE